MYDVEAFDTGGQELDQVLVHGDSATRVALCAAGEIWGGVEQFVETTALELHRRGVGFVVLLLNDGLLARRLRDSGLPVEVIRSVGKYDPTAVLRIRSAFRRNGIRVVHVNGYRATLLAGIAAKLEGLRLVKTEHGRLEPFEGWGQLKMRANLWLDETFSRGFLDAIVFVSRDIQRPLSDRYRRLPQSVIYNAIHSIAPSGETRATGIEPGEGFRLGIIGRLKPIKGHEVLLRALKRQQLPAGLRLYILGEGPTEGALRSFSESAGLNHQVVFLGFRENIHDYMGQMDALAMPSFHEGIPYTALEAMSLGVPLVASDVGGLREILENEVDALLVPPGDDEALWRAIARLASDPNLRTRLSANARRKVNARFLAPLMVDEYLAVYRGAAAPA